jgi:hypothetical protein
LSERFNRILGEKTRALLKERKLERSLWEDAMKIIVDVQNRILNDDQQKTPFELMNGFKPNLSNLRIFGVPAFVYNFDPLRRKLDDKATEGIFIEYDDTSACYKIYSRKLRKVMKSIYVIFNESGEVRVDSNDLEQVEALLCDFDVVPEVAVIDSDAQESSRPLPSSSIPLAHLLHLMTSLFKKVQDLYFLLLLSPLAHLQLLLLILQLLICPLMWSHVFGQDRE